MSSTLDVDNQIPNKCEVCGRQDHTVRFVIYPYVFSVVFYTFQRAFTGCWCRFHRIQKWLMASFITSIFGWLGIPFGLVFTPVRLLQLARGGLLDEKLNGHILRMIGERKYHSGDVEGALRCFEASLLFVDDQEVKEQLRGLYRSRTESGEAVLGSFMGLFTFSAIPVSFFIAGMLAGLFDFIVRWAASFISAEIPIYVIILLQVPLVVFVYFSVILAGYAIQSAVGLTRIYSLPLLIVASIVTSFLFVGGIISGGTYGLYLVYFINGYREAPGEILSTLAAMLTRGGFYIFNADSFSNNFSANTLFAALLFLSLIFSILVMLPRVKTLALQQERMDQSRSIGYSTERTLPFFGWMGLVVVVAFFALSFMLTPQKSSVDGLVMFDRANQALNYMNLGEYDLAIEEYEQAIELNPQFPFAYSGLGYAYYFSGAFDKARENFELALSLQPELLEARSGLGWAYLQLGEIEQAGREFHEVLQIDHQNLDAHLGLGWMYFYEFDMEKSRVEFENVIAIAPDLADAYVGLGGVYFADRDYERALETLNTAISLNPNIPVAHYYMGSIYYRQGLYVEAEKSFQAALKVQPDYYDALYGLGEIRVINYEYDEGVKYFDKAIALDPERPDAHISKTYVFIGMGKFDEALDLIEPFAEEDVTIKPLISYIYYRMERHSDAERMLQEAVEDVEELDGFELARSYGAIAAVYTSALRFDEARRYYELARDANPLDADADSHLAFSYIASALGEFEEAEDAIHAASLIGHSELSLHLANANLLINQEKLSDAEDELQLALQIDDTSANAYTLLSFVHFHQGDVDRALVDIKRALQLNPYHSSAHAQLAFIYQAMGRTGEALPEAQEAVKLNTLDDASHYILGLCYMESNMSEEAIGEFEKFLGQYWDRAYIRDYKVKAEEYLEQLKQTE